MTGQDEPSKLPFSQRTGINPVPPQLELGVVSKELRRLIDYYATLEIKRGSHTGYNGSYFEGPWERVARDLHVLFFKKQIGDYSKNAYDFNKLLTKFIATSNLGQLFDFIEFLCQHDGCSVDLKTDLAGAFVRARSAYRIINRKMIVAIGSGEEAASYLGALNDSEMEGGTGARAHLLRAGSAIKDGRWEDAVRECIHAVESVAVYVAPDASTLSKALVPIQKQGLMNGRLKSALEKLYAYTSDTDGVRHALVFEESEADVDEIDALFMLGACSSFVSYLLSRRSQLEQNNGSEQIS